MRFPDCLLNKAKLSEVLPNMRTNLKIVRKVAGFGIFISVVITLLAGCANAGTSWKEDNAKNTPASANERECISGNCEDGKGALTFSNGNKYIGEFKNGSPNGQIIFTGPDGTKYIGEFKNGSPDGQGDLTFPNGSKYVGKFKNGLPDGPGTYTDANGNIEKGVWRNNVWHIDEKQ